MALAKSVPHGKMRSAHEPAPDLPQSRQRCPHVVPNTAPNLPQTVLAVFVLTGANAREARARRSNTSVDLGVWGASLSVRQVDLGVRGAHVGVREVDLDVCGVDLGARALELGVLGVHRVHLGARGMDLGALGAHQWVLWERIWVFGEWICVFVEWIRVSRTRS